MASTRPAAETAESKADAKTPAPDRTADTGAAKPAVEHPGSVPAGEETNPASKALDEAVRKMEIEQLTKERDELREKVGDAPDLPVLRAEVDALRQVAARAGLSLAKDRMSAGVASDLEQSGYAVDPANGGVYVRDGDTVTVTSRSGETRSVDMPPASTRPVRAE